VHPEIVLPCLDEAEALPYVLKRMPDDWPVIVVDNGSTDDTAAVARGHGARVVVEPRRGYGAAVHAGLEAASGELVAFLDGDGSLDADVLPGMAETVASGRADIAVGRRVPDTVGVWPWHARAANAVIAGMLRTRGVRCTTSPRSGSHAGRRCWTCGSRTGRSATRWSCCCGRAGRAGGSTRSRSPTPGVPAGGPRSRLGQGHRPGRARHDPAAAMTGPVTTVVLAKAPEPGRVKTRLCPPATPELAAAIASAALLDTLDAAAGVAGGHRRRADRGPGRRRRRGRSGRRAGRARRRRAARGGAGRADRRRARRRRRAAPGPPDPAGRDGHPRRPTAELLSHCAERLAEPGVDAVLGPATDGGWWVLGLRDPLAATALHGVPMSTAETGDRTLDALRAAGLRVALAEPLTDVDTAAEAVAVAAQVPGSRFARAVAELTLRCPEVSV
jgi:glycosyltransferase A (GT-A) superfamily protein (DUF2064 family)